MSAIDMDVRAASSTGLDPTRAAALAYLAGPFSGVILLMAERTNRFVRFHAWQALIGLGGLGCVAVLCLAAAFLGLFVSPSLFKGLFYLSGVLAMAWVVVWGLCLWKAYSGSAWKLPAVGGVAESRALRGAQ